MPKVYDAQYLFVSVTSRIIRSRMDAVVGRLGRNGI